MILRQFIKYAVVGGTAFVVDFLSLYTLTEFGHLHYLISASIGFLLGLLFNYVLCLFWIFDQRALDNRIHEFLVFGVIGLVGLGLNNLIVFVLTEHASLHYLFSKIVAAAVVLMFNFGLRRQILFRDKRKTSPVAS